LFFIILFGLLPPCKLRYEKTFYKRILLNNYLLMTPMIKGLFLGIVHLHTEVRDEITFSQIGDIISIMIVD